MTPHERAEHLIEHKDECVHGELKGAPRGAKAYERTLFMNLTVYICTRLAEHGAHVVNASITTNSVYIGFNHSWMRKLRLSDHMSLKYDYKYNIYVTEQTYPWKTEGCKGGESFHCNYKEITQFLDWLDEYFTKGTRIRGIKLAT